MENQNQQLNQPQSPAQRVKPIVDQKKSFPKWLTIGVGLIILLLLVGGAYWLGKKSETKTSALNIQATEVKPIPTSTPNPTVVITGVAPAQTKTTTLKIPEYGVQIALSDDIKDAYYLPNSIKTENNISWIYLKVHSLDSEKYCSEAGSGIVALNKVGKDQVDERTGSKFSASGMGTLIGNYYYFMDQEQAVCSQNTANIPTETNALKAFKNTATKIESL